MEGEVKITIDQKKIEVAKRWDGLKGSHTMLLEREEVQKARTPSV